MGLLKPSKGYLIVDGQNIYDPQKPEILFAWRKAIAHVPQNIYLADETIASNISFGIDSEKIDQKEIERAAKIANLHEFIINELPQKYQTTIGERGVRLSGGQRQRIGIARALYNKPQILILDEATSALDNLTEKEVMEAINKISRDTTIILIAHRLSTVKNCDIIFLLEKGKLKAKGTFDELIKINTSFRENTKNL